MIDQLQHLLAWVNGHPTLTLVALFLGCIAESMVVIGMVIPTAALLLPVGALVALGSLQFWPTVGVAVAGALVGDSINFFVGRRWGARALDSKLAERYSMAIARSRSLFARHGAKALVIARFVGLVRPFISAIAGTYGMSPLRFLAVEVFACVLWAAPHIAAGVVFGASLSLAAEVATRFAILLIAMLIALGLLVWAVNGAVSLIQQRANGWLSAMLDWSQRHRQLGRLGQWLADSNQPETPALAVLALLLFAAGWLWLALWWGLGAGTPGLFDTMAWQGAQDYRSPLATALAMAVAQFADWQVYLPVAVIVLLALLSQGRTRAAAHWLAAVAFGAALSLALYWLLKVPDPINYFRGKSAVRFGGRDLVLATVIYAFLPVLLATDRSKNLRTLYYAAVTGLIGLMLAADVYLGTVWLSTGLFAVVFGGLWVTLLGIGYRRHGAEAIPAREVLPLALGVLIAAAALESSSELRHEFESQGPAQHRIAAPAWWSGGFSDLPAYRVDASGLERQPLSVQWRGELDRIDSGLRAAGWEVPQPLSWESSLRWLAVSAPIATLPILPQLHAGKHQALMLRKGVDDDDQWVIRLWSSGWYAGGQAIWVGTLVHQTGRRPLGLLRYPRNEHDYVSALAALGTAPAGFEARRATHTRRDANDSAWNGAVWLLRPRGALPSTDAATPTPSQAP